MSGVDEHLAREFVRGLVHSAIARGLTRPLGFSSSAPCSKQLL